MRTSLARFLQPVWNQAKYPRRFRRMPGPLVWIDCEMTGLNPKLDQILEISCFVTGDQLNLLEPEGFTRVIHCSDEKLAGMDEWCQNTHGKSGLIDKVKTSTHTAAEIDEELLNYVKRHVEFKKGVLAGNSVYVDRMFLANEFPKLNEYLHYRIVDVSSIKEVGWRHNPDLMQQVPPKKLVHTARDDILESIDELRWYYANYLKPPTSA